MLTPLVPHQTIRSLIKSNLEIILKVLFTVYNSQFSEIMDNAMFNSILLLKAWKAMLAHMVIAF
jgi:hypothetical protein